ncbi:MAG: hypothetical protein AAFY71_06515 [Bacteroidota bacterium]
MKNFQLTLFFVVSVTNVLILLWLLRMGWIHSFLEEAKEDGQLKVFSMLFMTSYPLSKAFLLPFLILNSFMLFYLGQKAGLGNGARMLFAFFAAIMVLLGMILLENGTTQILLMISFTLGIIMHLWSMWIVGKRYDRGYSH